MKNQINDENDEEALDDDKVKEEKPKKLRRRHPLRKKKKDVKLQIIKDFFFPFVFFFFFLWTLITFYVAYEFTKRNDTTIDVNPISLGRASINQRQHQHRNQNQNQNQYDYHKQEHNKDVGTSKKKHEQQKEDELDEREIRRNHYQKQQNIMRPVRQEYYDDGDDNSEKEKRKREQQKRNHLRFAPPPEKSANVDFDEIGDFSEEYQSISDKYNELYPPETISTRMSTLVERLRKRTYESKYNANDIGYDVFNCPDYPPPDYPYHYPIMDVLNHWNPDDPKPRQQIHQGICVFQYSKDYEKAMTYREAEVPFVIRDDPEVLKSVERWNDPTYLETVLNNQQHRAEYSENNHFMYWTMHRNRHGEFEKPREWKKPTKIIRMTYPDWISKANRTDDKYLGTDTPHWYFRLIGCGFMGKNCDKGNSEWLYNDLSFFKPTPEETLYLVQPEKQKGIHCRFGMTGVIAENHFDATRNMIVLLGGERRYILSHPNQCEALSLYPRGHPSARHSAVDWSNPDLQQFPQFESAKVNEIVLQAGDVLYLPTFWFHYIISLELNYQCNTRSGVTMDYKDEINSCGF